MSQFKYEKLILDTAKALQCFIEEYKRDRPKFLNNNNNNNNNQQQPQIGELTEDKVKLITTYALLNLTNVNNQKDFNLAVERYLNDLRTSEDGKTYVRYNNTWKEVDFNSFQGRPGRDGYTPYIQNGKWFLNNVDLGVNATGESAYDIAKRLNKPNTDSEENWVNSLKGNKGEQGEKGLKGDKGTGISSITLSNETDKTYLNINLEDNTNSKLLLPLLKGDKGEPGRDVDPVVINRINQEIDKKVDKVNGKQLSTNDFTTAEKQKLESIDLSTKLDKGTYSGTAKDLNDKIEQILTLLSSNNVNLDTLQEIVDFITLNRSKLETLGISNIAGLTQALSDKAPLNHNHDDRYMLKEHKPTWNDIQNKPDNLANIGNIQDLQRKIDQVNEVLSQKASTNHTHNWNDIQSKPSINKSGNVYTIPGIGGNIEIPSWVTQTKPTYDWTEIQNKPEFNYLLLSGGMITPTENNFREGIRIGDKDGWSLVQLGAVNTFGTTENSWTITKKPNNSFQISNGGINDNIKKGLNLTANSLTFSDNTNTLFEVTNELVHTNKVFDAPYIRIHQSGSDYISLNSKDYKLNVKVGSGNRDSGEFKPVLASGYEVPNGTQTKLLTANGESYGLGVGQKQIINLKGLNENKYYLIYCTVASTDRIKVRVQNALNWTSKPSWSTHDGGFSLNLEFEQTGNGWGSNNIDLNIIQYNILWTNVEPVMNIGQISQSNKMYMYLRGGGEYYVYHWSQEGKSDIWANPRKSEGNFEENGVSLPYCKDWDNNLKVVATTIRSYKDGSYGEVTKIDKSLVINEIFLDNYSNSKTNIWTQNNELNIGSRNNGGYTKINCNGYKKVDSSEDHFLLGNGEHEHRKFLGRCGEISSNWTITQNWYGQSINILAQCNVDLSPMENNFNISFRKCFAGGQVTFITTGKTVIFTGDNQFNGGDGSTCVVSSTNNKLYIDIRNI